MAKYTGAIFVLILGCVGVTAPPVRMATGAPVIGEVSKLDNGFAHGVVQGAALAAFDPTFDITPDGGGDVATRVTLTGDSAIVGIASFYEGAQETSSGEQYDPAEFTAAAQLEIRDMFGGIRYGKNYQPAYAIGEFDGKKIIVKFNDVGPLKPGRKFDLSRAAMAYFDNSLTTGLLPEFKMTPLPLGQSYKTGPVSDEQLVAMGIAYGDDAIVTASVTPDASVEEIEAPAKTAAAEMERDDALQERLAFADPDAFDGEQYGIFVLEFDGSIEGISQRFPRFGDLIATGRRLVAWVGDVAMIPAERRESAQVVQRRDGKAEDGAGFHDVIQRRLLLL